MTCSVDLGISSTSSVPYKSLLTTGLSSIFDSSMTELFWFWLSMLIWFDYYNLTSESGIIALITGGD